MKNRVKKQILQEIHTRKTGRLIVLTGARQTGKTTLAKEAFPDKKYISLEDPVIRPSFSNLSALDWIDRYPDTSIDEVQKAPTVVESIKAAYDENPSVKYLLLGSSQILLLKKIKESLAGRVHIEELFPLTLPEMATNSWDDPLFPSRFVQWLQDEKKDEKIFIGIPLAEASFSKNESLLRNYLYYGAMPAVWDSQLTEIEKQDWLNNYQRTYLERDIVDIARLNDLEPFILAQKALALRTGKVSNFSDLARNASISTYTAKRFLSYLEISYQVISLAPYFQNEEKRLVKSPKIIFLDPGIYRGILKKSGEVSGQEFETAIIAEIWKQCKNLNLPVNFYHLKTVDGREVDLLIELEQGFVAIEIKMSKKVFNSDAKHLRNLQDFLKKPLIKSFVFSNDPEVKVLEPNIIAVPAAWVLGAAK